MIRHFFLILICLFILNSCHNEGDEIQIKKSKISGFVQKGPFVTGTTILMNELNGKLEQSGRSFTATISNDNGLFEINNILLGSPFVEINASGYYFNEVSGELSSSQLVLSSLSDLRDKNSININVLTHLEKQRLQYLIGKGVSFAESKVQSRREVLSIFSVSLDGNTSLENFDLFTNNKEGGVLLAISIILQQNRTVGQLTELLSKIQQDIAADGKLDDQGIIKSLRFGTIDLDFEKIRNNVKVRFESLNVKTQVPDFESHITNYALLRNLNIVIEGEGLVEENIVTGQTSRSYPEGIVVELKAVAKDGWMFDSWSGDLTGNESLKQISVDKEKTIKAKFKRRDYPLNILIEGEGAVNEKIIFNPSAKSFPFQTVVEITPVPSLGSVFERWEGDLTGSIVPEKITVDKEKTIKAIFRKPIFRIMDNGVTCICENVKPGERGVINGVEYEAVDNQSIRTRRDEGKDMTKICTSLVTDLSYLFSNKSFNQNIGSWDVSNVLDMREMFDGSSFNQPIENWNVGNVTNMRFMFNKSPFNQPIGNWNVSKVTNMENMFAGSPFNQPIGNWDVGNVTNMRSMFQITSFNQPIGNWNVKNVRDMTAMFSGVPFNQPIGSWDVSNVLDMREMFDGSSFNQPIENWNVGNVTNMKYMFNNSSFNQPIGNWNVSKVTNMGNMFARSPFNQNISAWCVTNISTQPLNFSTYLIPQNKPVWGTCPQ